MREKEKAHASRRSRSRSFPFCRTCSCYYYHYHHCHATGGKRGLCWRRYLTSPGALAWLPDLNQTSPGTHAHTYAAHICILTIRGRSHSQRRTSMDCFFPAFFLFYYVLYIFPVPLAPGPDTHSEAGSSGERERRQAAQSSRSLCNKRQDEKKNTDRWKRSGETPPSKADRPGLGGGL